MKKNGLQGHHRADVDDSTKEGGAMVEEPQASSGANRFMEESRNKTLLLNNNTSPELIFSPFQSNSQIVIAGENEAYFIKVARNHRELRSSPLLNCNVVPRNRCWRDLENWGRWGDTLGAGGGVKNLQVLITSVAAGHRVDTTHRDSQSREPKVLRSCWFGQF